MNTKKLIALLLLFIFTAVGFSASAKNESTDLDGVISSIRGRVVSPKVGKFSFFVDQEIRSTSSIEMLKLSRTSLFTVYDPLEWLKVSGGYTFLVKGGDGDPVFFHRYILAAEETLKLCNFKFTLRERLESTTSSGHIFDDSVDATPNNLLRTRLKISFAKGKPLAVPYIYTEIYNHTNMNMMLTRVRSHAGVEFKLSPTSKLSTFYQYTHFVNIPVSTIPHTVGALYVYTFKNKK